MCTFLFFPLFLRSLSRCLHTQVSLSLPFFFFWFFIFVGYFFFSVCLFYIFLSFFFLAPLNSRFVFASFYRKKKKEHHCYFTRSRVANGDRFWRSWCEKKKRKGRKEQAKPPCISVHVFQMEFITARQEDYVIFFFFSSQESTTSGCSLTSFPPPHPSLNNMQFFVTVWLSTVSLACLLYFWFLWPKSHQNIYSSCTK